MTGQIAQFGGSLLAILALAWIAHRLGLGGDSRIRDEGHLRELADEALCGFDPVEVAIDREGAGGLARDGQGRLMLLRLHGAHFASRMLDSRARAQLDGNLLIVDSGDKPFGIAKLYLGDAATAWADRLKQL